ncbi:MAG: hypothetical protein J6Y37_16005 [Paludibacteraceae bacterium]|nr:hypothetical protein [Paludibacteraceae bacterium]
MKPSQTLILTILLLLAVNTQFLWKERMQVFFPLAFLIYSLLLICVMALFACFVRKVYPLIKGTDRSKQNVIECIVMAATLCLIVAYPMGIVRGPQEEVMPIKFKAYHEGGGGCGTTLYFREDGSFVDRSVCFGIKETKGSYRISNDTIYFSCDDFAFDYAVMDSVTISVHRKNATGDRLLPLFKICEEEQ